MGQGNCCTTGPYEGLYYIDNDDIHVYRRADDSDDCPEVRLMRDLDYEAIAGKDWCFDEVETMFEQEDIEACFITDFTARFTSFSKPAKEFWVDRRRRVILENQLFYVAIEDNQWSLAVELLQKDSPWSDCRIENLQKRHYAHYLAGIRDCLLKRLPSIGYRKCAWTSGTITREEAALWPAS